MIWIGWWGLRSRLPRWDEFRLAVRGDARTPRGAPPASRQWALAAALLSVRWCICTVVCLRARAALRIAALLAALSHRRRRCEGSAVPPAHRRHRPRAMLQSSSIIYDEAHRRAAQGTSARTASLPPPTRQALDSKNSHRHTASCARRRAPGVSVLRRARLSRPYPCCGARLTCRSFARCLPSARGSRCTVVPHGGRQQRGRPTGSSRDTDAIEQPTPRARTGVPTWPESGPTQVPLATLAALPGQVLQWLRTVLRGPWSMMGRRPRLLLLHLLPRCMAGVCSAAFSSVGEGSQLSSSSAAAS